MKIISNFLIQIYVVMQNEDKVGNKVEETLILELLAGGGKVCVPNSNLMFTYFLFFVKAMLYLNLNLRWPFIVTCWIFLILFLKSKCFVCMLVTP